MLKLKVHTLVIKKNNFNAVINTKTFSIHLHRIGAEKEVSKPDKLITTAHRTKTMCVFRHSWRFTDWERKFSNVVQSSIQYTDITVCLWSVIDCTPL